MTKEFNPNPWEKVGGKFIDRTYPSGVAGARPLLTTRIHCEPDEVPTRESAEQGSDADDRVAQFHRDLRAGLGTGRPTRDE